MELFDATFKTLDLALGAAGKRQEVLANNLANVNTPGYKRLDVQFDGMLAKAVDAARAGDRGALDRLLPNVTTDQAVARATISAYARSRAASVSSLLSARPGTSPRRPGGRMTAATTSGPAQAPRPASSAPATWENPERCSTRSNAHSPFSERTTGRRAMTTASDTGHGDGDARPGDRPAFPGETSVRTTALADERCRAIR